VDREVEDLAALIERAGGSAYVYGVSSGAALALETADRVQGVAKLALYEAPFVVDGSRARFRTTSSRGWRRPLPPAGPATR
jgi:pimeloyl-ACP methyl ester carboxylesterase